MARCRSCSAEIPERSRFCLLCGAAVVSASEVSTDAIPLASTPVPSNSFDEGRFPAGTVLAERYRIIGLVGRGGMGEVYRASDLKLGQPVALKFLPAATAKNQHLLARFLAEVRIARQVSHPNVCRVYDIGEVDGFTFLSNTWTARISVPCCAASDACREIKRSRSGANCARALRPHTTRVFSVLHRDLKPANVMIDGRGQVVITISVSPPPPDNSTEPTSATARPPTWPPNSSLGKKSPSKATSTHWASCCTKSSPASARSKTEPSGPRPPRFLHWRKTSTPPLSEPSSAAWTSILAGAHPPP